ncbi:hypothetical protein [Fischerella thermalis]|uniref:hypothetical protein n=1 Tax=Fischerella thermalis TaxID=372787 RepID=UPI0019E93402|nr:hypothetical protein [Fischerella thermalis]MBF1991250.1 hypothetical protein [Fischerella thermalis M58_A2018_009]
MTVQNYFVGFFIAKPQSLQGMSKIPEQGDANPSCSLVTVRQNYCLDIPEN